ncbi:MAG: peptidylprolyl isomerase [Clostridia bacterium]|nr:peptidylprolyl isomerase [Clostridia bacterium]
MAKSEKSKAELYREERKERIASAAKKNAKKSRRHPGAGRVVGRVIGILLIVAIVGGAVFGVLKTTGAIARMQTAFTVGSHKVSVAEYGYMYYMQYQNTANQAQQSEQNYGYNMYGFDYKLSPEEQDSPYQDDDGNAIKWSEQLEKNTVDYMQEFYTLYDNAVAKGYKVTDEEKADIDEQIESMRQTASGANSTQQNAISMSLNSYLKVYYGEGITESFMRGMMEKEMIVQRFSEEKEKSFEDKYTDEEVDKEYKEDTTEYDVVDLRMYGIEPDTLEAKEGEKEDALAKRQEAENAKALKNAQDLLAKAKDEASFITAAGVYIDAADEKAEEAEDTTDAADAKAEEAEDTTDAADVKAEEAEDKTDDADAKAKEAEDKQKTYDSNTKSYGQTMSNLTSAVSEDAAKWAFDAARKAGDKKVFTTEAGKAYAVYVVKPAYPQETVDVRHILFMTVDTSTNEPLSDDEIAEKKAKAEEVLKEWEDTAEKTSDAFGELANQYSEDPGSNTTGGLYESVTPGQMVDSFDSWIFDAKRKEGDVEIVESEYGYHIMYYVGNKDLAYRKTIRTTHTQDDYSSWLEGELKKDSAKVTKNAAGMASGYARAYKLIDATVKSINANASNTVTAG